MDIITVAIFAATLAALLGAYALWQAIGRACSDVQARTDARLTRVVGRAGAPLIGSSNKAGDN